MVSNIDLNLIHEQSLQNFCEQFGQFMAAIRVEKGYRHLPVSSDSLVRTLKFQLELDDKVFRDCQRLTFEGQQLEDDRPLSDYNIVAGSVIRMENVGRAN